ncbi:MAG: hypothetical protein ABR576_10100, partial [Thermoanaerobaculia bacterium]
MRAMRKVSLAAAVALGAVTATLQAQVGSPVENWPVPERPSKALDLSRPVSFVAMVPCRIVDTRGPVGLYGGPALAAGTTRDFDLDNG